VSHYRRRCRSPPARLIGRARAARTSASDPTTRTFVLARVTSVYNSSGVSSRESSGGISTGNHGRLTALTLVNGHGVHGFDVREPARRKLDRTVGVGDDGPQGPVPDDGDTRVAVVELQPIVVGGHQHWTRGGSCPHSDAGSPLARTSSNSHRQRGFSDPVSSGHQVRTCFSGSQCRPV
jgi:hypothetical protein